MSAGPGTTEMDRVRQAQMVEDFGLSPGIHSWWLLVPTLAATNLPCPEPQTVTSFAESEEARRLTGEPVQVAGRGVTRDVLDVFAGRV